MKETPVRSFTRLLLDLSSLLAAPIFDNDGYIVISREASVFRHVSSFPDDSVGFEVFVNHVHLDDVLTSSAGKLSRQNLMRIGEFLIRVWSDRLQGMLRGREVRFYLGGASGVTLRFHLVRENVADWLDLRDEPFIRKEKMRIFRLHNGDLTEEDRQSS